jgi:inhibitor of cysteine peptidase
MRKLILSHLVLFAILCLIGVGGCSSSHAGSNEPKADRILTPRVRGGSAEDSVTLRKGQTLRIELPGESGTGYQWRVNPSGGATADLLTLQHHSVGGPSGYNTRPGDHIWDLFTFRAEQTGQGTTELGYLRPWEKDTPPAKRYTLNVTVTD